MEIRLPLRSFLSFVLVSGLLAFGLAQSLQQQQIWRVHSKWGMCTSLHVALIRLQFLFLTHSCSLCLNGEQT